jgi:hypothetical protein
MERRETVRSAEDARAFRLGGASVGAIVGLLVGLALAVFVSVALEKELSFPLVVFGLAALGGIGGYFYTEGALRTSEGRVHLLIGVASGFAERIINPLPEAPWWLRLLYWAGFVLGICLAYRLLW